MRMGRQRREGPEAWAEDMEQAGCAGVGCRRHHLSQGSIPDVQPGDDEPKASHDAATGFPDIGTASPEVER
jgi:hypothetical protein